jgi:hypothetical protein
MGTWLGRLWRSIKLIYLFLLPTRFSLLAVVLVGWAFLLSDQGADILRALVEYDPCKKLHPHYLRMLAFVLATNAFAYQAWYWTRQILRLKPPEPIEEDQFFAVQPPPDRFPRTTKWFPRILGALGLVIPIVAFFRIGRSYTAEAPTAVKWLLIWLILSLVAFLVFVVRRRTILSRKKSTLDQRDPQHFGRTTKVLLLAAVVAEAIFFVWATRAPVSLAPLGSASLVFLTAALWISFGTVLVMIGIRLRFPILSALLVWAVLVSPIADWNHVIRTIDEGGPGPVDQRAGVVKKLDDWYNRVAPLHVNDDPQRAAGGIPIFVVATEGGGIRAAYWTASVLTAIQDSYANFADHLFAISGVSGGSLGAEVFDAVLAHGPAPPDPYDLTCPGRDANQMREEQKKLRYAAKKVLSFDALTPVLAGLTQPDLAQRFLPFGFPDRQKALEEGWERGWSRTMNGDSLFSKGILTALPASSPLPSLFLNGTMVETGDRTITSDLRIRPLETAATCTQPDGGDNPLCEFRNAFDSFAYLRQDIPFSAGAGMSARFTYVSPAGRLPKKDAGEGIAGHVVDGGYFENSGAVTAAEIVNLIRRVAAGHPEWRPLRPYVILIDFTDASKLCKRKPQYCEPNPALKPFPAKPDAGGPAPRTPERWVNEILSPLRALLGTRDARGSQAVGDARELLGTRVGRTVGVIEFRLIQRRIPLPLGWLLSERSRIEIDQATQKEGGNLWAMKRIGKLLGTEVLRPDPVAASAKASATALNY